MISHLGSLVLISGIALIIAAPFHHDTSEHHKRHEEPEEHHRIREEHHGHGDYERETIFQEPEVHHRIHEEPVEEIHRHPHGAHKDIQEGPIVNYGSINNYFEEPQRDEGYETGYLVEPYGPSYLVPAYPEVYDNLYEYDYYSSYDIVSYDSMLWEGRSSELYEGLFDSPGHSSAVVQSDSSDDSFFRYLRHSSELSGLSSEQIESSSSEPSESSGLSSEASDSSDLSSEQSEPSNSGLEPTEPSDSGSEPSDLSGPSSEPSEPSVASSAEPNSEVDTPEGDGDYDYEGSQYFDGDSQRPDASSVGPDYEGDDSEAAGGSESDSANNKFRINSDSDGSSSDSRDSEDFDFDY